MSLQITDSGTPNPPSHQTRVRVRLPQFFAVCLINSKRTHCHRLGCFPLLLCALQLLISLELFAWS